MADADTVLAKLDETVQAFDEAHATLVDSTKLLQTWRTELADAGHRCGGPVRHRHHQPTTRGPATRDGPGMDTQGLHRRGTAGGGRPETTTTPG